MLERLQQRQKPSGPAAEAAVKFWGLPIFVSGFIERGHWQWWRDGRLVEAGQFTDDDKEINE